jgi:hypothetical protein
MGGPFEAAVERYVQDVAARYVRFGCIRGGAPSLSDEVRVELDSGMKKLGERGMSRD